MAEVEFTLPTAQYANVKVRATPEELGLHGVDNAYELGVAAAVYLNLFQQGYRTGSQMDVSGPVSAPEKPLGVGVPGAAEQRVQGNLKPRTAGEANDMAAVVIKQELGATEVDSLDVGDDMAKDYAPGEAPWDQPAGAPKPKPWETGGTAKPKATAPKAVVSSEW